MTGFEGYLKDFESARGEALQALDALTHCKDSAQRENRTVEARTCIDEVERYIRILENEVKEEKDARSKRQMENQVRHCQTQHTGLCSTLEKTILIGDARKKAADTPASSDPKEQAVRCAEILDRNGRHLDEAQRTLAETEAIAANTANNLLQQRNQLEHAQLDVGQAQEDTHEARSHLRPADAQGADQQAPALVDHADPGRRHRRRLVLQVVSTQQEGRAGHFADSDAHECSAFPVDGWRLEIEIVGRPTHDEQRTFYERMDEAFRQDEIPE